MRPFIRYALIALLLFLTWALPSCGGTFTVTTPGVAVSYTTPVILKPKIVREK